ncbi:hypothetical protein FRB94_009242 [Tulasnella sp. JGI-2019a]|nr:hypothetical protein FRB94_009242 [Tulasnella sp. JGI-2019a]KAG9016499.1 hypothetical protein FRB93_010748 [Tulasnella sp. JGI-2019a]KAG9030558.1 hypothetical protein FRB95_003819 [Tulasnella sp. JGI-2019a]
MKTTLPIAGLDVHIHTQSDVDVESTAPAAVVFLLHGRLGNAQSAQIDGLASSLLNYARNRVEAGENQAKELIVVTFDHRNHGSRLVNDLANQGWAKGKKTHNERHAIDMFAVYAGTSRDVSFLIDFLPAYLYPSGEREVVDWGVIGISLGGHSTWMILKEDPRVTLGIPIIGIMAYHERLGYDS